VDLRRLGRSTTLRVLAVVVATSGLALAAAIFSGAPASASPAQEGGVKFLMQYQGTFGGTYSVVQPVGTSSNKFVCSGQEEKRSMTSSVRPARPYYLTVYKAFGSIETKFSPNAHGSTKGRVSLDRAAASWLMRYSGGQCTRYDETWPGCGSRTFLGQAVPLDGISESGKSRVHLQWQVEPDTEGCIVAIFLTGGLTKVGDPWEGVAAFLDSKKLYRCGMARPRACRITIGGKKTYTDHQEQKTESAPTTTIDTVLHIEWKLTLVAVGRVTE
jgi:hypothetical protein